MAAAHLAAAVRRDAVCAKAYVCASMCVRDGKQPTRSRSCRGGQCAEGTGSLAKVQCVAAWGILSLRQSHCTGAAAVVAAVTVGGCSAHRHVRK